MATRKRRRKKSFKFDRIKTLKALSRKDFGRPGQGRKTSHTDRKKKADREACRKTLSTEE